MAGRLSRSERLAIYRHRRQLVRQAEQQRRLAKRLRVARALELMVGGSSMSAAVRMAHTTPAAIRAEVSPGSLRVKNGRVVAAAPSRIRINLGTTTVLTPDGLASVRLRTLQDFLRWRAQSNLLDLVERQQPVPAELERYLRGATIDGKSLVSSPEVAANFGAGGGFDDIETLSPTLADDSDGTA